MQADEYAGLFNLKIEDDRRGLGRQCGFPVRMLKSFKKKAISKYQPYIVIGERGYLSSGLKRRVVTEIINK